MFFVLKVLASAFSTEVGRLRDAGSELAAAAASGAEDGMVVDGGADDVDFKAEASACMLLSLGKKLEYEQQTKYDTIDARTSSRYL